MGCLLFDYQQKHIKELKFATAHCDKLGVGFEVIQMPPLGGLTRENWVVKNRNAIMLSIAVNKAARLGVSTVTIGCNADDAEMFPDCRPEFFVAMNASVRAAGYNVEICTPYITLPKAAILRKSKEIGIELSQTWSCYEGMSEPCGECPACLKIQACR